MKNRIEVEVLTDDNGKEPFEDWINSLDNSIQERLLTRINRMGFENFGYCKNLGSGIFELRFVLAFIPSGYRSGAQASPRLAGIPNHLSWGQAGLFLAAAIEFILERKIINLLFYFVVVIKKLKTKTSKKQPSIGKPMKKELNKIKNRTFDEFIVEHFKKTPQLTNGYLKLALEEYQKDGDERPLLEALKQVALARGGLADLSAKTGLSRESLYKTLSSKGNPTLKTLNVILKVLGYRLSFQAIA
jgi:probable addiction module antidote protein